MDAAAFYTGIVVDAYAKLKSSDFDPEPYARFVAHTGQPGLEIGCGDGNPLLELRRRGLDVEGVDSSADMVERCRRNAAALGVEVVLHQQRMQDLALGRRYRSIYFAGPTFNLLPDDAAARRTLRAVGAHLTADGTALVPLWIPGPTPPEELGAAREAIDEDGALLRYTAVSEVYDAHARTRVTTTRYERITPAGIESVERPWILHWYSTEQFGSMCAAAGLRVTWLVEDDEVTATVRAAGPARPAPR
ncbi:class I SAM-dependent methyltransferase [Actinoplanes sp. NPDC049265]|uniref:class I SAM-dependent methyltransferase n=1 Tax=Actinoplanes sp. NPDC049265 TaxID=3363902 RepID=UPI0037199DFC